MWHVFGMLHLIDQSDGFRAVFDLTSFQLVAYRKNRKPSGLMAFVVPSRAGINIGTMWGEETIPNDPIIFIPRRSAVSFEMLICE